MLMPLRAAAQDEQAAQADPCKASDYKVLNQQTLLVLCATDVSKIPFTGDISLQSTSSMTKLATNVSIGSSKAKHWLVVTLSGPETLHPDKKYLLSLSSGGKSGSLVIDTATTVLLSPVLVSELDRRYKASSKLAFKDPSTGNILFDDPSAKMDCTVQAKDYSGVIVPIAAKCDRLASVNPADIPFKVDPFTIGFVNVEVSKAAAFRNNLRQLVPAGLPFLNLVLGTSFKIDEKSKFAAAEKVPTSKDASQYYVLFSGSAGVGSAPAWVLDGKIAPLIPKTLDNFQFAPSATANVGQGTIKGQTYTNTIDLGFTAQRLFLPYPDQKDPLLQGLLLTVGPTYETDKEFDRDNLLAVLDLRYNFKGLYAPQTTKTLQNYYKIHQKNKTWQLDQQPTALWGYALDFHTGIETGGALVDTTVKASTGKATQNVPTYPICRIVPQVHGLLQFWWFSVDATGTPRYLTTTEYTVEQLKNNSLLLKRVTGWNALGDIKGTFSPGGTSSHWGITVEYKDGFAPPTFLRVNAVQYGLSLKY
jgi:hypothetical protein